MLKSHAPHLALASLVIAAVGQTSFLVSRALAPPDETGLGAPPQFFAAGDYLPTLSGKFIAAGSSVSVDKNIRGAEGSRMLLVLAFNSTCAHCETVAPVWAEALKGLPPGVAVLGVTADAPTDAMEYRQRHVWSLDLLAVPQALLGSPERRLVMRTPWLFVVEPSGRIRTATHGAKLNSVLASLGAR